MRSAPHCGQLSMLESFSMTPKQGKKDFNNEKLNALGCTCRVLLQEGTCGYCLRVYRNTSFSQSSFVPLGSLSHAGCVSLILKSMSFKEKIKLIKAVFTCIVRRCF